MRKEFVSSIFLFIAIVVVCVLPVAAVIPSGGTGWIAFKTNVPDASVSINGVVRGTTDSTGEFDIQWDSSFTSYTLTKNLYNDVNGAINFPTGATNIVIPITMTPVPAGSGTGYFVVHANVDGATVSFDGQIMGSTYKGLLTVPVATTHDLFTSYAVSEPGYQVFKAPLSRNPANGEVIDLYATLIQAPTVTPYPVSTQSTTVIGGSTGWYAVHSNVEGASVWFDNQYQGQIKNGILNVLVYITGTPFVSYSVRADGYNSGNGFLPAVPGPGEIRDVYMNLTPSSPATAAPTASAAMTEPTTAAPTPTPTTAPLPPVVALCAVAGAGVLALVYGNRRSR